jgi:hypothetical protein
MLYRLFCASTHISSIPNLKDENAIKVSVDLMDPVFVIGRGELVPITKTVVIEDGVSSYTTTKTGGYYLIDT